MEVGRRFAQSGVIEQPEDIFHLGQEEIKTASTDLPGTNLCDLVAERQDEIRRFADITPPPILGMNYGPPPDNFITRAMGKFFGTPPEVSEDPNILHGSAGSPGKVRGTARVLGSVADGHKLNPGDVLVAQTTAPPWTPLFATAGAIVTDTEGF